MNFKYYVPKYNVIFTLADIEESVLKEKLLIECTERVSNKQYDIIDGKIYISLNIKNNEHDFINDLIKVLPKEVLARETYIAFLF